MQTNHCCCWVQTTALLDGFPFQSKSMSKSVYPLLVLVLPLLYPHPHSHWVPQKNLDSPHCCCCCPMHAWVPSLDGNYLDDLDYKRSWVVAFASWKVASSFDFHRVPSWPVHQNTTWDQNPKVATVQAWLDIPHLGYHLLAFPLFYWTRKRRTKTIWVSVEKRTTWKICVVVGGCDGGGVAFWQHVVIHGCCCAIGCQNQHCNRLRRPQNHRSNKIQHCLVGLNH